MSILVKSTKYVEEEEAYEWRWRTNTHFHIHSLVVCPTNRQWYLDFFFFFSGYVFLVCLDFLSWILLTVCMGYNNNNSNNVTEVLKSILAVKHWLIIWQGVNPVIVCWYPLAVQMAEPTKTPPEWHRLNIIYIYFALLKYCLLKICYKNF